MESENLKLEQFESLSDEIGERKSISKRQLDEIISRHNWDFEPGEVEDFLSAHDIVLLESSKKKSNSRSKGSNVWLYSQELSRVKILSRDDELKIAFNMRSALQGMLGLITISTVTIQRFVDLFRDPEFYGLVRLANDESGRKQNQIDTMVVLERISNNLIELKKMPISKRNPFVKKIKKDVKQLLPSFKIFDAMQLVFEKLAKRIADTKSMSRTIMNITGDTPNSLQNGNNKKLLNQKVLEMFNVKTILNTEANRTHKRWDRWKTRLEHISLVEPSELGANVNQYRQFMDKYQTAKRKLVESNIRLVMNIAKNYVGFGVDYLDLVQEGNHALLNAVERFDPNKGFRLATYTIWWIRQGIMQLIARQSRSIRIPTYVISWVRRFGAAKRKLHNKLGREPNDKEIADELDITEDKVREFTLAMRGEVSLDSPISKSDNRTLEEVLEDNHSDSPVLLLNLSMIQRELRKILTTLTSKEAEIISMRYGLNDNYPRTLNEIGDKFGLSRERIRQIEGKALKKLRSQQNLNHLGAFFHSDEMS